MAASSLLIALNHAPHGSAWAREGLEAALVAASLDQTVTLLLVGDGVFVALQGQTAGPLQQKGTLRMLEGLEMYDIGPIQVDKTALEARGLKGSELIDGCETCDARVLLSRHTHILVF